MGEGKVTQGKARPAQGNSKDIEKMSMVFVCSKDFIFDVAQIFSHCLFSIFLHTFLLKDKY